MPTAYERLLIAGAPPITEPLFYRIAFNEVGNIDVEIRESRPREKGSDLLVRREVDLRKFPADRTLPATVGAMVDAVEALGRAVRSKAPIGDFSGPDTTVHSTASEGWL